MQFGIGDVVRLRSGGAQMVVAGVFPGDPSHLPYVRCAWHSGDGAAQEQQYHPDLLVIVSTGGE